MYVNALMQVCVQASEVSRQQNTLLVPDNAVCGCVAWGVARILPLLLAGDGWGHGREDGGSCDVCLWGLSIEVS